MLDTILCWTLWIQLMLLEYILSHDFVAQECVSGERHESIEVFRGADCLGSVSGRGRNGDWRGVPVGQNFGSYVL
jgi:hypothetical protein